ncbi:MAG: hypothetical protein QW194_03250 [Candidatus Micrarchaeaceae archaeon]|jgi:uncharacterized membrane protein YhdT|nr:hypothetical protein [Candidatus Parvarchaeota archaeon]MCW1294666.1 hypothetical protein [Candidatus Parvarchaeum tengchongense]MCW1295917.1 hypothetical protein [Candidatus Parvarchaeum tengchongense]
MMQDIKKVITTKRYALMFSIMFAAVFILYFYLLESSATGIIDFGSYYIYFDLLSSFVISFLISLVITMNVYSYKLKAKTSKKLTLSSIVGAILPSSLCCTSIIPSLLAVLGFSTSFIVGNTGKIQSIFSIYGPLFIAAGAAIAYFGLMQITKNINASCKINVAEKENCCEVKE